MRVAFHVLVVGFCFGSLASSQYPLSVLQRPFTMPQNAVETTLRFNNKKFAELSADYGITDYFQMGVSWGGLNGTGLMPEQKLGLHAAHFLYTTPHISGMASLELPLFFQRVLLQEVTLSLATYVPLVKGHLNLVVLENLIKFNWLTDLNAEFHFPVRLSWQATQALCLNLVTDLAVLHTHPDYKDYYDTHIAETTPVTIKGLYAVTPTVDLFSSIGLDNIQNGTGFSAMLGVAFRAGAIDS